MSVVTREEFDALAARVTKLDGGPVTIPPIPPLTPPLLSATKPSVTVTGDTYKLSASIRARAADPTSKFTQAPITLTYLQLAVRGANAVDLALMPATTLAPGASVALNASAPGSGPYTAWVAYSVDGVSWVDGPAVSFTVASPNVPPVVKPPVVSDPPVGDPRSIGLVGRSGLGFNSLVFRTNPADADAFGAKRGTPVDGFLLFSPRQKWADFQYGYTGFKAWLDAGRLIVMSMPHAPESEGDAMNDKGANDAYKSEQRALGAYLTGIGMNSANFVIRVDWEANGDWYHWSASRPGGAPALKLALAHYITNLRAGGLTKTRFDLCWNKGPSQTHSDFEFFPGPEYVDVVGIDQYDMWGPSFTDADWAREQAKRPSLATVSAFAKTQGIMWSLDEMGNTHGGAAMGGDNPFYWVKIDEFIQANRARCAWQNTYDDRGSPNTLMHDFDSNPLSYTMYKKLFTPR